VTAIVVKQLLPTREVPKGNSSGKRLSNSWSQDVSYGRKFVCTNSIAQSSAKCSSSSYDQVYLFLTFLLLVCRYLRERKSGVMRKKKRFCEWTSIWAMERYRPVYNEIALTKPVLEQCHSRLSKTEAKDGATVPKQISQRSTMLRRFRQRHKFVQNDGHHLPMMDQHGIFTNLYKIIENQIVSLVFPLRWGYNPKAYYLPHRVGDTMPRGMKMLDYLSVVLETQMLGEAQFDIPINNPHRIRGNTLTSELEEKNLGINPTYTSKRGKGL